MSSDSSGWMIFMNGYNREVDPHPRHGYGIDVEGLSWLISSISTSDKALERKKERKRTGITYPRKFLPITIIYEAYDERRELERRELKKDDLLVKAS